jgi:eukaryotic-like serine/threonine-protein kinase
MIGRQIANYKIIEKLGEGGMGIVFKAEDTILKRLVALKFLKPQTIGNKEEKARFMHEAQAAASLDHSSICTVFEIKDVDGHTFISMSYIKGQTLEEKIGYSSFAVEDALDIILQIAHGLQIAHAKGIVHRDIKSANIMITQTGQAKIMDFGIAHLEGGKTLTQTGAPMGTPSYMSPEQIRGDKVDHKSDIFSLGILFYEMLTGNLPFKGEHKLAIMHSILYEKPIPPETFNVNVPQDIQTIISKAIEKKSVNRYQTTSDFIKDLEDLEKGLKPKNRRRIKKGRAIRWTPRALLSALLIILSIGVFALGMNWLLTKGIQKYDKNSIAVMYFDNLTNESGLDWRRYGFAELLTTYLRQESELRIADCNNLVHFLKGAGVDLDKRVSLGDALNVARKLGVGTLIMGNFFNTEERTTVNIKLYDVNDRKFFAGEQSDIMEQDEIFKCMNNLSDKIKTHLEIAKMNYNETMAKEFFYTHSVDAFKNYILGTAAYWNGNFPKSLEYYLAAITVDSTFILPHLLASISARAVGKDSLARAIHSHAKPFIENCTLRERLLFEFTDAELKGDSHRLLKVLFELLTMEPNHFGYTVHLGTTYNRLNQGEKAMEPLEKAMKINPNVAQLYYSLGLSYHQTKQFDKEMDVYQTGLKKFPDTILFLALSAREFYRQGDYEKEKKTIDKALLLAQQDQWLSGCYSTLGRFYLIDGHSERAIEFYTEFIERDSSNAASFFRLGRAFFINEDWANAIQEYQNCISVDTGKTEAFYWMAQSYERLEDFEKAMNAYKIYLEKVVMPEKNYWPLTIVVDTSQHYQSRLDPGSFIEKAKDRLVFLRSKN